MGAFSRHSDLSIYSEFQFGSLVLMLASVLLCLCELWHVADFDGEFLADKQ